MCNCSKERYDGNAALQIVKEFELPAAVAVKHMNPCGVGTGVTLEAAFDKAYEADPTSIFGGIIALNMEVDAATAEKLSHIFPLFEYVAQIKG